MPEPLNRRTDLAGSLALLGGRSALDGASDQPAPTTLDSTVLRNRYRCDDVPSEAESADTRNTGIALLVELDGEVVQRSKHVLKPDFEYIINDRWPSTAGAWTGHARELQTERSLVANGWLSIDLSDAVAGDETTDVAVDGIVKETGRIELDATAMI